MPVKCSRIWRKWKVEINRNSMVKLIGNDIYRDSEKIGWLQGNHVFDHEGKKLGYFEGTHVYDYDANKIAYIEGDELLDESGRRKILLETVNEDIEGILPEIGKCAIYTLLGN
jgi:hypothetical protein